MNDDANFAGTVTSSLALKAPLASPALTGTPTAPTASAGTNTTQIATTAFVTSAVALENTLAEMDDVTFASLADNELLQYNSSNSKWENKTISEVGLALASDLSTHIGATNPHNITLSGLGGLPLAGGTLTGVLKLPDGAVGAPALSFANDDDSGIYWDNSNSAIRFSIDGVQRAYFSTAGILSTANVYTGNTGQFRNYGGTWKATTGLTGNGFEFSNSVDGTAMTLSSAGNLDVGNNITLGGTVDGRDVATDGSKLDGIAANANNYSLPAGSSSTRGGFKIGYTENGQNYPVEVSSEQMFVNVPWVDTNTTYSVGDGGLTQKNFTTALKDKLDGITANADVTPTWVPNTDPSYATQSYVGTQIANLVDSAPDDLNTLNELAAALGDDANFATTTSTSLGNRLRVDTNSQGLSATQQGNALTNLGITASLAEDKYPR